MCSNAGPGWAPWSARPRRCGPRSPRCAAPASPGASALTAAELRLLPLLSGHLSSAEIGAELFVSPNTAKTHAVSIYRKLNAGTRGQAVARARELGLLGRLTKHHYSLTSQRRSASSARSRRHSQDNASRPALTYIGAMPRSPSAPHGRGIELATGAGCNRRPRRRRVGMGPTDRFHEILRRLAIIDEGFVEDQAGLGLPASQCLDPKAAALVRVGALVAIGSPGVCLEWSITRALAAGATDDEVTDVLLAIAPVAGLGRVTGAVPGVAAALGYDVDAALLDPDDH